MTMLRIPLNKGDFYETYAAYWLALIHSLLAVQTDNLSSTLPTQTYQLHRSTSRTSFFDNITSCRETAVVLELSNVTPLRILDFTRQNVMLINPLND